jgi:DNA polymerase-3 subunit beta
MVNLKTHRNALLEPLQAIAGIVERRHTLPILSNVLIEHEANRVAFTATDLEMQMRAVSSIGPLGNGAVTVSARKLHDILRSFPDDQDVGLETKDNRVVVKAGKSRFSLQLLPAQDFPRMASADDSGQTIEISQAALRNLLAKTHFAMAQQDIRYYLNGLLFALNAATLRVVATDGHRLSMASYQLDQPAEAREAILPRKAVAELVKLLGTSDEVVKITLKSNQAKFEFGSIELTSKLIDGKFPDYLKVVPVNYQKHLQVDRVQWQQALQRAAILSNDKVRGVRLTLTKDNLAMSCTNNEQEEAQEDMAVAYTSEPLDIGFNLVYLLDVLNHLQVEEVDCSLGDSSSSALITIPGDDAFKYVVMPMRI